jgi:hypothetical protein
VTTYRALVQKAVDYLTAKGVAVMLSLAVVGRGPNTGCNSETKPILKEMADTLAPTFWTSVANTYKNNPYVWFDLFNEAHGISDSVWLNGGTVHYTVKNNLNQTVDKTYTAVGMQTLANSVRATGATNPVLICGTDFCWDLQVIVRKPVNVYGQILSKHIYCWSCKPANPGITGNLDSVYTPELLARYPQAMTEGGWDGQNSRFIRYMIDYLEPRSIGWEIYSYSRPAPQFSLVSNWNATLKIGTTTYTKPPSYDGIPVWNSLAPIRVARGYLAVPYVEPKP